MEYTITVQWFDAGPDIVTTTDPVYAVEMIQDARRGGWDVEFTGDPFADVVALTEMEG